MKKSFKIALSGLLLAMSAGISAAESLLPLPLGVKPGFSNIPVMFAIKELGVLPAFMIVLLKSFFVLLTRGVTAFIMSLAGGVLSFLVMVTLFKKTKLSTVFTSIMGSLAHNVGQTAAACVLMGSGAVLYYASILIISGITAGAVTGIIISLILPVLEPFLRRKQ